MRQLLSGPAVDDPAAVRRLGRAALEQFGVRARRVDPVAQSHNSVFRVRSDEGDFALRVGPAFRAHPIDAAHAEAELTAELADAGIPVPRVRRTLDGPPAALLRADDVAGERECMLLTWTPGRPIARPASDRNVERLGVLSARLHAVARPRSEHPRGAFDGRRAVLIAGDDLLDLAPRELQHVFADAHDRAQAAIDSLWTRDGIRPALLHNDLTVSNVLLRGDELLPIDFQDASWVHVEQDLAITLYGFTGGVVPSPDLLARFRRAYETVRPWPALDDELLRLLLVARRLTMVSLALHLNRPGVDGYLEQQATGIRTLLDQPAG